MNKIVIGVGGLSATNVRGSEIKTFALGSCVAVILLDPRTRTVGMAHVALPDSKINAEKALELPGYFADTALPALLREMKGFGCEPTPRNMIVKLAGGANVADPNNTFNIGKRNVLALKKLLWQYGIGPKSEDVGGNISRTVTVDVNRGGVLISSAGRDSWKI